MKTCPSLTIVGFLTVLSAPVATAQLETLRYSFEDLTPGELTDGTAVANTADDPDFPNPISGTVFVPPPDAAGLQATATIVEGEVVAFDGVSFSLGNSLELMPIDPSAAGIEAAHILTNDTNSFFGTLGNSPYTAMAWARIDSTVDDNFIFGNSSPTATRGNGSLHLGGRNSSYLSGHWGDDLAGPDFTPGEWHHVTFTNDFDNGQAIYVNGEIATTPQATPDGGNSPTPGFELLIGTSTVASNGTGSFLGGLDQVRVFADLLTPEQILAAVTDGIFPLSQPTFLSAALIENENLVITINDFVGTPSNATVDVNNLNLLVDGLDVEGETASKAGGVTTLTYAVPAADLPLPLDFLTFEVQGVTVETNAFDFAGQVAVAALPNTFPGTPASSPDFWVVDEYNSDAILDAGFDLPSIGGIDAHRAMVALIAAGSAPTTSTQRPVIAFNDPDSPGQSGIFNRDTPFASEVTDVDDDNFVLYARTQFIVDGATTRTFSIQADDAYALRVNDAQFVSINGGNVSFLDPTDQSTVYSIGGTNNTNVRAVCNFPAAGTYVIELLYREVTQGAFVEIGSAEGTFETVADTSTWELVGNPDDATLPVAMTRFPIPAAELPAIPDDGSWNTRWYYEGTTPTGAAIANLQTAIPFLNGIGADPESSFSVGPIDANFGFINFLQDTGTRNQGNFNDPNFAPPSAPVTDVNNSVMLARTNFTVAEEDAGDFTFQVISDDGFILKFPGEGLEFTSAAGIGLLIPAATNEYFVNGSGTSRAVINLPAGTHEIQFLFVENAGSLAAEISFAPGAAIAPLTAANSELVGIFIAPPELPFGVTNVELLDNGNFEITYPSDGDNDYQIEVSLDLETFVALGDEFVGEDDETLSTAFADDILDALEVDEMPERVFFRVLEFTFQ